MKFPRRFSLRTIFAAVLLIAIVCAVVVNWDYIPGTYYRDNKGISHGTGWTFDYYKSGEVKVKQYWRGGEPHEFTWYKPDGTVFATSKFHRHGLNVSYFLRDDGSMSSMLVGTLEPTTSIVTRGTITYFRPDGSIEKVEQYQDGDVVKTDAVLSQ